MARFWERGKCPLLAPPGGGGVVPSCLPSCLRGRALLRARWLSFRWSFPCSVVVSSIISAGGLHQRGRTVSGCGRGFSAVVDFQSWRGVALVVALLVSPCRPCVLYLAKCKFFCVFGGVSPLGIFVSYVKFFAVAFHPFGLVSALGAWVIPSAVAPCRLSIGGANRPYLLRFVALLGLWLVAWSCGAFRGLGVLWGGLLPARARGGVGSRCALCPFLCPFLCPCLVLCFAFFALFRAFFGSLCLCVGVCLACGLFGSCRGFYLCVALFVFSFSVWLALGALVRGVLSSSPALQDCTRKK